VAVKFCAKRQPTGNNKWYLPNNPIILCIYRRIHHQEFCVVPTQYMYVFRMTHAINENCFRVQYYWFKPLPANVENVVSSEYC